MASERVYKPYRGKDTDHGRQSRPRAFPLDLRLVNLAKKIRRGEAWPDRIRQSLTTTLCERMDKLCLSVVN